LLNLRSRSLEGREAQFDNSLSDPDSETSNCDFSDVDNAFESIVTLRTAIKSHGHFFAGRR
jgi:hypothetical protein